MTTARWSALLALQQATHATLLAITADLAGLGLTAAEINVLANLADGRSRTVSQLGADVGTKPSTLTSVLDRLERRGHIARVRQEGDRRAVAITLTGDGERAAARIARAFADLEERALAGLDGEQIEGLRAGLNALTEVSR
ncbi:MarR family winged helix-turn-helix transcriptional regulator [Nonomuraea soli]|uniref:DNA-binding MarR family transcriptional regulator n=1 Tax=Nonomuraea soli TaxID=1032476 RepID=A0A7W0CR13_9ACTN|nr:MarR family transcriptional regulator [Nonomuraea soli]MBA2895768.1 DNA-binding MarR family transcriptional regulator [Nonomuraea soli]